MFAMERNINDILSAQSGVGNKSQS